VLSPPLDTAFAALRHTPPRSRDALVALVQAHLDEVLVAGRTDPFVDQGRAGQVANACFALLELHEQASEAHRDWIQAACLYFAECDDGEDDLGSIVGFEDDAEVLNHVIEALGLPQLLIDMDAP